MGVNNLSTDIKDFVSSKPHMVEYNEKYHVCNNTAHNMLVERNCFIGRLLSLQRDLEVPTIYKTLSAYSYLGGLCGPHSTVEAGGEFSLNLWILLVGASGARKSSAMSPYHTIMGETEALRELMLPEDATTAAYREPLDESYQRSEIHLEMKNPCSSGIIFAQEFGDFVKADNKDDFSSYLVKMWGDQSIVKIGRQSSGGLELIRPTISILGAIQTKRLMSVIPLSMWHQGFFPRVIPAFSSQEWKKIEIKSNDRTEGEEVNSAEDEQSIINRFSHLLLNPNESIDIDSIKLSRSSFVCGFNRETSHDFNSCVLPDLPRQLEGYGNRRHEIFRKLCGLTAISRAWGTTFKSSEVRSKAVVITKEDFDIAYKLVLWFESQLPEFTKSSVVSVNEALYQQLEDFLDANNGYLNDKQINEFCKLQPDPRRTKNYLMEFCLTKKEINKYGRKFEDV